MKKLNFFFFKKFAALTIFCEFPEVDNKIDRSDLLVLNSKAFFTQLSCPKSFAKHVIKSASLKFNDRTLAFLIRSTEKWLEVAALPPFPKVITLAFFFICSLYKII